MNSSRGLNERNSGDEEVEVGLSDCRDVKGEGGRGGL